FPREELVAALENHPGYKYASEWVPELSLINDGDHLSVGDYNFTCLVTPGHTLGHTCLWEEQRGILVAGDHILGDITPNIQCWKDDYDPLASYLDSLERVSKLPVRLTLPGHRSLVADCTERIKELAEHHHHRLAEIIGILGTGSYNAYQTAARMSWDIRCDTWEEFPVAQKWFATGEAMAHLRYLENKGDVAMGERDGVRVYRLPG
ncbi:MAG: MBL fold metallo-hydrolase, partial [Desulfarculaceae bacterium]|nr:MBL fold metallo-hydrolase [Desulfarculaceae bacterium]